MNRPANGMWQVKDELNDPEALVWFEGTERQCRDFLEQQWGVTYTAWINHRTLVPDES